MLRTLAVAFTASAALGAALPAAAENIHGALAVSSAGAYGYSYNYPTQPEADARARDECAKHAPDCQIRAVFTNQCVAVARGANGVFGWDGGPSKAERPGKALAECARQGGLDCQAVVQFCSGIDED